MISFFKKHGKKLGAMVTLASLAVGLGYVAEARANAKGDCCHPGAACCHPGAACCKHGGKS